MYIKNPFTKTTLILATAGLFFTGCESTKNMSNRDKGVAAGAVGGAVIGAVVGSNVGKGNTSLGVLVGAVVGGAAGGIIGAKMDKQAEQIKTEIPGAQVERVEEGINITFKDSTGKGGIYFGFDQDALNTDSRNTLDKLVQIFKQYPDTDILVEGHTDSKGTDEYNLLLSKRRSISVSDYLVNKGIAANRITSKWYGESQPVADNETEAGRASNRRVEVIVTANDKMKTEAQKEAGGN